MKKYYSIILVLFVILSCKKTDNSRSMNDLGININETKIKALVYGEEGAYQALSITYLDFPNEEFLPIALEMANKHNYPTAYFDVYFTLICMENLNEEYDSIEKWKNINPKIKRFALEYLLSGVELEHEQSIETLKEYYLPNKKLNEILYSEHFLLEQYSKILTQLEQTE